MRATVILQKCAYTRKTFGIRVQEMEDGEWYKTWAFPIDEASANREGYDKTRINSMLPALPDYPGCPYCGSKGIFYDHNCGGRISCYNGEEAVTCPWCNVTYNELGAMTEKAIFTGGDM